MTLVVFLVIGMSHLHVPAPLGLQSMHMVQTPHHLDKNLSLNTKSLPWDVLSIQTSVSC